MLSVYNVAPTITSIANSAGDCGDLGEHEAVTVTMDWTDPRLPDSFTAVIDWGDGSQDAYAYEPGTALLARVRVQLRSAIQSR